MPETVMVALIVGVLSLPGTILTYLTFMQNRKNLPHTQAATDAGTEKIKADTIAVIQKSLADAIDELFTMRKQQSDDQRIIGRLTDTVERLTNDLKTSRDETHVATQKIIGLEQQVKDYPQSVRDLEKTISDLREIIVGLQTEIKRLQDAAAEASETNLISARARERVATNSEAAVNAALHTPAPNEPEEESPPSSSSALPGIPLN